MYVAQEHSIYGSSRVGVDGRKDTLYKAGSYSPPWGGANTSQRALGLKSFELANHLGNVLVTVSDKPVYKVSSTTIFFQPEVTSISDYYPFGAPIQGRGYSTEAYRFGFNGKENDGESETQDYGMRINDCRLGRFLSVDPLVETTMQPYSAFNNNPIRYNDPTGMIAEDPGDIYSSDGTHLKNDGIDDKKVYVVDKSKIVTTEDGTRKWANNDQIEITGVTNDQLLQTAASANNEWEKSFEGRAAIANTIINRMEKMGLSFDVTMGSLAGSSVGATHESRMKSNWFTGYQELINAGNSGRNSNAVYRSCVSASLDAYGGGFDYSNGAIGWQGTDFFSSKVRSNGTHWPAYLEYKAKGFKWDSNVLNANGKYPLPQKELLINNKAYFIGKAYYGRNIFLNH